MMGKEYSKDKLAEHKERLKELEIFVKKLNIPRSYENKYLNKDYEQKVLSVLDHECIDYRK